MAITQLELWKNHAVTDVNTISEFLDRYYKHDRYKGRGEEYASCLLSSHENDFIKHGVDTISHHDSNTGTVVAFYDMATLKQATNGS